MTNLELPLGRNDFCIDTADPDARVEVGTAASLNQVTGNNLPNAWLLIEGTVNERIYGTNDILPAQQYLRVFKEGHWKDTPFNENIATGMTGS